MGESFKKATVTEGSMTEGRNMFARWMAELQRTSGQDVATSARQARRQAVRKGHYFGRAPHPVGRPPRHVIVKRRARSANAKAARRRNRVR